MNSPYFDFETLKAYKLAMDFTLFVRSLKVAAIDRKVLNHLIESADSVVLNIAEGRGRRGRARLNHYEIALGSAGEAAAALDIVRRGRLAAHHPLGVRLDLLDLLDLLAVGAGLHGLPVPGAVAAGALGW